MPSLDTIRTLTIKATTDGVDDATKSLNDLADAQKNVSVVSDTTSKSTLSAASALDRLQKSLDPNYKATAQLQSAQTTLGKSFDQGLISLDKYNQLMGVASQRFDDAGKKATPFNTALTGIKSQIIGLSAGLGPVGETLASFGPIGLAAGAGIALISAAFDKMSSAANDLGAKAQGLNTFATVTGLTIDQVQALNETAAKFGLTSSDVSGFVDKFTAKLTELRTASGPLYDQILKIDAGIAQQMLTTKSTTAEIDLLAKAYQEAGADKNALLIAAGGRGGVTAAPVLGAIADAGGLNALNDAMDKGSRLADAQSKSLAGLKAQNDSLAEDIKTNIASIFSNGVLQNQVSARSTVLDISLALKNFSLSSDWGKFVDDIKTIAAADINKSTGGALSKFSNLASTTYDGAQAFPAGKVTSSALPALAAPAPPPSTTEDPVATANKFKVYVSALGSAATASDQLKQKTLDLNASLAKGSIDQATYDKALSSASLDAVIAKQNLYNSTLGEFATTQDLVSAKSLSLQKAQQQGAGLTTQQIAAVKNLTAANDEWSRVSAQAQIGVFDETAAQKALNDQLQVAIDKKLLDPKNADQMAAAQQNLANKLQATAEAAKVAGSAFPQLTQLGLDASNVNKQFDTFATTSLNNFSDALVSIGTNASTAGAAFQNFGLQVLNALEKMIVQLTIIKPLAASLSSSFGGSGLLSLLGFGGANPIAAGGVVPGAVGPTSVGGGALVGLHAGGIVGSEATFTRYVHPSYFDDAPRFHSGGIAGNEVPIIAQKGEGVFTQGQMKAMGGGGQTTINYSPNIDARGADAASVARLASAMAQDRKNFERNVQGVMAKTRQNNPGA